MIFEKLPGGRMIITKLTCSLAVLVLLSFAAFGQGITNPSKTPDPEALKKDAVAFLRETMADVNNLRTLENRISFSAELAGLMWFHDEKEARSLYLTAFTSFRELLLQYDHQMNSLGSGDDEEYADIYSVPGSMFTDITDRARLIRKFQTALQVRQQIAMSLAEHDPDLAYQFYFDSVQVVSNPYFQKQASNRDTYFENELISEIANNNATKGAQLARRSIEEGLNFTHVDLLRKIHAKDPEKGAELAVAMLGKVKSDMDDEKLWIVHSFLSTASESLELSLKEGGKKAMLTRNELRDLADTLAQAILNGDKENENLTSLNYVDMIEKYNPGRATQIRAKYKILSAGPRSRNSNVVSAPSNSMIAAARAANSSSNSASLRAEAERMERERSEKEFAENIEKLGNRELPKEEREKIVGQARRILHTSPGRDKKILGLSALAAQVARAGDKDLAAEIMRDAQSLVNPMPKNYQDLLLTWMLASGYAESDPARAFPLLEDTIMRVNDTLAAFIKVGEFIDVAGEMIEEGEVQVGAFGGSMIRGLTSELGMADGTLRTLAKADFRKTRDLTSRFDRSEVRILAKMMILRAVLGEKKQEVKDVEVSIEK